MNYPKNHDGNALKRQAIAVCLEDLGSLMKGEYPNVNHKGEPSKGCSRMLNHYVKWVKSRLNEKYHNGEFHEITRKPSCCICRMTV
jgi:hypothetical protein